MVGRTRARAARSSTRAFTLVELMVVIVVVGLIGGVAVVTWSSMLPKQQFHSAIRNLSEVLYGTRSEAIARNREFRIQYDLDADTYRVRTPFKEGGGFATSDDDPERLWMHETDLKKAGIDLQEIVIDDQPHTDGAWEIYFTPVGASTYHTILLRDEAMKQSFTLEVLPLTGEIRMHDGGFTRDPVDEGDFR
ncbi:MAG: prepilin-type N-terminal cleavage/methylation domain-containing protein [Planctomycetes bacterium]|nr:prepilin-type N-terminal cleavage/methylation domain-containing protein [Planctomycetota bacterium]